MTDFKPTYCSVRCMYLGEGDWIQCGDCRDKDRLRRALAENKALREENEQLRGNVPAAGTRAAPERKD